MGGQEVLDVFMDQGFQVTLIRRLHFLAEFKIPLHGAPEEPEARVPTMMPPYTCYSTCRYYLV